MSEHNQMHQFLPHRRQRPLSDNADGEFAVLHHSKVAESSVRNFSKSSRAMAMIFGLIAGLGTVGTGALVLPFSPPVQRAQVAGLQTTAELEAQTSYSDSSLSKVCWNQIVSKDNVYHWKDTCRGLKPDQRRSCVETPIALTEVEIEAYLQWVGSALPLAQGC